MSIPLRVKILVCLHVFQEKSVIFNVHFFGKTRIRKPRRGLLSVWNNLFEEYAVGQDNFMVLPDDLPGKLKTVEREV